ncbi:MAG: DNA-3-methyladenine glycosylase I [Gammaproteobacteria bacterium]|nr:DNA-3-methyladenine glycosylase I [Gammaproteobacteria bacterium]
MSISYPWLYEYALRRKGSIQELEASLPVPLTEEQLTAIPDDRYLSLMTRRIFRAGLRHAMVDARWPAFEEAFWGFDPEKMVLLSAEHIERHMQNKALIRHLGKLRSIPRNAQLILDISREHGGFGRFLAQWPVDDIVGLWFLLRKRGYQLGGYSTPGFLRMAGKDTFLITTDVVAALIARGVIDRQPTSQGTLRDMQKAFNQLHQSSGRPLCQLSAMLAWTVNHD